MQQTVQELQGQKIPDKQAAVAALASEADPDLRKAAEQELRVSRLGMKRQSGGSVGL